MSPENRKIVDAVTAKLTGKRYIVAIKPDGCVGVLDTTEQRFLYFPGLLPAEADAMAIIYNALYEG